MPIKIIKQPISKTELAVIAAELFGDMIKAVVDIDREIMAVGGELHADEESLLLDEGSRQEALWGINLYPEKSAEEWVEYDSMINLRPSQGNRSRGVDDPIIREKIAAVVKKLLME